MVETGKPLSELANMMEIYPQKLINVDVRSKPEISSLPKVREVIKQVESELRDDGRVLVRYSGTQNMCRIMVEGPTRELTEKYCQQIAEVIREVIG
jgi:phosphoglucosamine mutase